MIHRLLLDSTRCRRATTSVRSKRLEEFSTYVTYRLAGKILARLEAGRSLFIAPMKGHLFYASARRPRSNTEGEESDDGLENHGTAKDEKNSMKELILACDHIKWYMMEREEEEANWDSANDGVSMRSVSLRSLFVYRSSVATATTDGSSHGYPELEDDISISWPTLYERLCRNPLTYDKVFYDPRTSPDTAKEFHDLLVWIIGALEKAMTMLVRHQQRPCGYRPSSQRSLDQDIWIARQIIYALSELIGHPSKVLETHLQWVHCINQVYKNSPPLPPKNSPKNSAEDFTAPRKVVKPSESQANAWVAECKQWLQTLIAPMHAAIRLHSAFRFSHMRCTVPKMHVVVLRHVGGRSTSAASPFPSFSFSPKSKSNVKEQSPLENWEGIIKSCGLDGDAAELVIRELKQIAKNEGKEGRLWGLVDENCGAPIGTIRGNEEAVHPEAVLMALTYAAVRISHSPLPLPPF